MYWCVDFFGGSCKEVKFDFTFVDECVKRSPVFADVNLPVLCKVVTLASKTVGCKRGVAMGLADAIPIWKK